MDDLRNRLIRLAASEPEMRPHLLPILASATPKVAARDTQDFVEWVFLKQRVKLTISTVKHFLDTLGVPFKGIRDPNRLGQPIGVGEYVVIQADKAPPHVVPILLPFDLMRGQVVGVKGMDAVIKMEDGKGTVITVPGGTNAGGTGVYRTSVMDDATGRKPFIEAVYVADEYAPPPNRLQVELVDRYVERGLARGEQRSTIYYSGHVYGYYVSKEENLYFPIHPHQREGHPRSLSLGKGTFYYIGRVGHRPNGWQEELVELKRSITEDDFNLF